MNMPTAETVIHVVANHTNCDRTDLKVEESATDRCVQLLEHAGECRGRGACSDGSHCYRACRVLLHHRACFMEHCSVCRQLKLLCRLHAIRCQKSDGSCKMPFCPNGEGLVVRNRPTETPATPCLPVDLDRALFTRVKSADVLKCLSAEDKSRVTNKFPPNTSLPLHHLGLKRHLPDRKLRCSNGHFKLLGSKTIPECNISWKAKVSIVAMK